MPATRLAKGAIFVLVAVGLTIVGHFVVGRFRATPAETPALSRTLPALVPESAKSPEGTIERVIRRRLAEGKRPNRLIQEKSPYLLQHAFNPVDWYPWGEEAFEKARRENRLIFLSVGYSTCYWCHVMEREVFENPEIARLMNEYVVSIKVDREERPDVDRVYMTALQAMTGGGGWPMSMFLTPDLKPFWGATYIPATAQRGRPGFAEILTQIHGVWTSDPQQVIQASRRIGDFLQQVSAPQAKATGADRAVLRRGFDAFAGSYDPKYAGFGGAPKFPRPVAFNFLFRYSDSAGEKRARDMALETLRRMASGGIYDPIGGGFHRYATDERWRVPHFEKMLYDQAQLTVSYLEAYQITHEGFYADVARDVLAYVQRAMTDPEGGFTSAEDAESAPDPARPDDKREGAFYTWKKDEIDRVLTPQEAGVFDYHYGVQASGNVTSDPQGAFAGQNILYVAHTLEETARQFALPASAVTDVLARSREKLFLVREKRPRPHLDDKVLVSWNGLMISAFARAHQVLGDERYRQVAERAGQFILDRLYSPGGGRLLRRYRDGEARYEAHLEDYAFLIQGLLDLYEASLDIRWLKSALALSEGQNRLFYDEEHGGFYDTSGSDRSILLRTKASYDDAEPAGNSIAILNLLRLSEMTGNRAYRTMAERSLACFGERMAAAPQGLAQFLVALDFSLTKPKQIILAGAADDPHTQELLREVHARFIPNKIVLLADGGEGQKTLASYVPFIQNLRMIDGRPTAYICENYACQLPTSDRATVAHLLASRTSPDTNLSLPSKGAKP